MTNSAIPVLEMNGIMSDHYKHITTTRLIHTEQGTTTGRLIAAIMTH